MKWANKPLTTSNIEQSPQAEFESRVNERNLFYVGSKIISFEPILLEKQQWNQEVYVIDLPSDCLSWSPGGVKDFYLYKYTKMEPLQSTTTLTSRKSARIDPTRIQFNDYINSHLSEL